MKIVNLKDYPEYIEEVSQLLYKEWQNPINGLSLKDTIKRTKNIYRENNGIPTILIILKKKELVGTASLWISDIPERQDLFPFLASLYIKNEFRGKGYAGKLIKEIEEIAINNNWEKIYLSDNSGIKGFYEKNGYNFLEKDKYNGKEYKIYHKVFK